MSWTPIKRPSTAKNPRAVSVLSKAPGRRVAGGLTITLRAAQMPECTFLKAGERVDVLAGGGDHAGMLRIQPGTEFRLFGVGKASVQAPLLLRGVPLPRGVEAIDRRPVDVEFDYGDTWVEVTLPEWARPSAPAPAPAPAPRTSLMDRVPDPVAPLRGARA